MGFLKLLPLTFLLLFPCTGHARKTKTSSSLSPLKKLQFLSYKTEDLNRKKMTVPSDLKGKYNLALIAFRRVQQQDVNTWLALLKTLKIRYPKLAVYEFPTISSGYRWVRFFIDGGMRSGIPDRAARARTITLYIPKKPFKKRLKITDESSIYAMVLNQKGKVFWKWKGIATQKGKQSLFKFLKRLY